MAIGQDVRTYLLTKASITTLLGTRIFPNKIPQKNSSWPCVVYQIISQNPGHVLSGCAEYAETRIQFDVYSDTALVRDSLTEALRNVLQGFSGTMGSSTVSSVVYKNSIDLYEPPADSSDVGLYRNTADYWFRHNHAAPTFT